ncbi:uncharacterized protein LOC127699097 [Mytilus californianus]|uniref:uncharacterized protein LOC127699097 n=1 Tax=Mytilus californianus TaxID=6549 RepID=UPI002246CF68|nr:uncharacterized protein LOC127699097 [Mytilus californianus]
MKLYFLVLVLAVGSQGFLLDDLKETFHKVGDAFTATFHTVGEQAKQVGTSLLGSLKEQGSSLLGQTVQSLLLGGMQALQNTQVTPAGSKRNLEAQILEAELKSILADKLGKYQTTFNSAIDTLTKLGALSHSTDPTKLVEAVDEIVHSHNTVSNKLLKELIQEIQQSLGKSLNLNKRNALTDLLGQVGQNLAQFFQPHLEAAKNLVNGLGTVVKQTGTDVGPAIQPHVDALKTSGAALLQHGQNALAALKDAVTDVLHQTLVNIKPHLVNVVQHGTALASQAGGQFVNHLSSHLLSSLGAATPEA